MPVKEIFERLKVAKPLHTYALATASIVYRFLYVYKEKKNIQQKVKVERCVASIGSILHVFQRVVGE